EVAVRGHGDEAGRAVAGEDAGPALLSVGARAVGGGGGRARERGDGEEAESNPADHRSLLRLAVSGGPTSDGDREVPQRREICQVALSILSHGFPFRLATRKRPRNVSTAFASGDWLVAVHGSPTQCATPPTVSSACTNG